MNIRGRPSKIDWQILQKSSENCIESILFIPSNDSFSRFYRQMEHKSPSEFWPENYDEASGTEH